MVIFLCLFVWTSVLLICRICKFTDVQTIFSVLLVSLAAFSAESFIRTWAT